MTVRSGSTPVSYWVSTVLIGLTTLVAVGVLVYSLLHLAAAQFHTSIPGTSVLNVSSCLSAADLTGEPPGQPAYPPFQGPIGGWGAVMLSACFASFVLGNWWGRKRLNHLYPRHAPPVPYQSRLQPIPTILRVLLVILLIFVSIGLLYEAYSVSAGAGSYWPITWYVRCADYISPKASLLGATAISALLGHWLAYRREL